MKKEALLVIDIQNDLTKNYKEIVDGVNQAIDYAIQNEMLVVYIRHNNLSPRSRTFKPDTKGTELVPELKIVSDNIFDKTKSNALTSEPFVDFIKKNNLDTFYITGGDATACIKSTCYNMKKSGYDVTVLRDCVTSYDKRKINEMLNYYQSKGCNLISLSDFLK